jgi:hypothetical protein
MSYLLRPNGGDDAHGRLRVRLGLPGLRRGGPATPGGLLRLLFLRLGPLPTQTAALDVPRLRKERRTHFLTGT